MRARTALLALAALSALPGCDDDGGAQSAVDASMSAADMGTIPDMAVAADAEVSRRFDTIDPTTDGPYSAAYTLRQVTVGDRVLPVGVWGPSEQVAQAQPLEAMVVPDQAESMAALRGAAPEGCVPSSLEVVLDGALSEGRWPVVLYSHCHECLGVSGATLARRLATWGHIVLAPDHVNNTLWNGQAGDGVAITGEFLEVRGNDIVGVLDAVAPDGELAALAPYVDLEHVGVAGHSYGAVTAGWVAERDPRIDAAYVMAAPVENPLIPGVSAANITVPTVMLVAVEDNSIQEIGNRFMRVNYEDLGGPAIKVEVADAGHWSVSDLAGLVEALAPGCGEGIRQTNEEPFTYLDPDEGRHITATWGVALFGALLQGDEETSAWLNDFSAEGQDIQRRQWP
ncbi:MAG: alpha/beta hydrolase family protein [Bradymonadia bacterium]